MASARRLDLLDLPPGFTLRRQPRSGHYQVIRPDGEVLRLASGMPVGVSYSPSDHRTRDTERSRIRRAIRDQGL